MAVIMGLARPSLSEIHSTCMADLGGAREGQPTGHTAHADTYVRDHLPAAADWPRLDFSTLAALAGYAGRINAAAELLDAGCILKRVRDVDELKAALWRTPRWGMTEWQGAASTQELAALMGRSLLGEAYDDYLAPKEEVGFLVGISLNTATSLWIGRSAWRNGGCALILPSRRR